MKNVRIIRLAATAAALLAALSLAGCGALRVGRKPAVTEPAEQISASPAAEDADIDEHPSAQTFREATLYYVSDEGYVVPVKKLIPWEEGIAKACLGYITSSSVHDAEAAKLGLRAALPAGTEIGLSISDGEARLDLVNLSPLPDSEAESAMLTARNALCSAVIDWWTSDLSLRCAIGSFDVRRDGTWR